MNPTVTCIMLSVTSDKSHNSLLSRRSAEPKHKWYGEGRWAVRDRKLSICRTRHRLPESDAFVSSFMYRRRIFEDKEILDVSPQRIVLERGPRMERLAEAAPK